MDSFPAGIEKNTNRFVSSSKSSWKHILPTNFFRIRGDGNFYEIVKVQPFCYNKEFEVIDLTTIRINEDVGPNLLEGDEVNVMHLIYEFVTIFSIANAGSGYRNGDVIKLTIPGATQDIYSGSENYTSLKVNKVGDKGEILEISILKNGNYIKQPQEICSTSGGRGNGAQFRCLFRDKISQALERDISSVERNIPSIVKLNVELPPGITKGSLTVNKWELHINSIIDKSIYDAQWELIKDFTPNYGFPLLLPNSFSRELVYNKSISMIDSKLKELETLIKELKG